MIGASLFLLTGCSGLVDQDQLRTEPGAEVTLEPGHPVGQTFVARHAGLNGVEIWLEPGQGSQGEISLHLRTDPQSEEDLATAVLPLAQVASPGFYRLSFTPLRDSHGRYYYAFLEVVARDGTVQVGTGPGEAYLDGALYRDHQPLNGQIAFRLIYSPQHILLDLGQAAWGGLGLLLVAGLLYIVPGLALLVWIWPGERLSWVERLGIAAGLSLALYPLLFLWTDLVGLHLGPLYAWLPAAGGLAALVWRYRGWRPRRGWEMLRQWVRSEALWPDLALMMVLGLVFGVRLLVVRTLDAPMWGDSYQHTVMAQLLVDHGGLFDSWEPYASLQTFTYHFGFHAAAAAFHWLSRFEMVQAVVWIGQILNGLAVLVLYPLAVRVSGNRWAGVGATLVAGLLSPMPMFYVNWGRYTQLAGQVILPAAVLLTLSALETSRRDWRLIILGWIAVGGLALTHYRVLIFYIVFVLAWVLLVLRRTTWRQVLCRVAWVGIGAAILFLPWFVHTFAGKITHNFGQQLTTGSAQVSSFARQYNAIGNLALYLDPMMWLLLAVAAAAGLWRRRREVLLLSLWWFLLCIVTNPGWVRLPGSGAISNFALFIAAYIPAGVLIGDLFGQLMAQWGPRMRRSALATLLVVGVGLGGARLRMEDIRVSQHALVTRPDMRAMAWIRENTPEDARFLVNSFFAYGGSVVVGSDGGWWLPFLTGRANTVPPLNYGTERGPEPDYREWVNDLTRQIQGMGIDDPATLTMLQERGITHVYIGQQQGRVNYGGPDVLDPETLLGSTRYQLVYYQDRVQVFRLVR
ncbi:MAG: DUF6541 family protein [Chloroflexota bacterium]|nr:DUF6541 family protein [Chloroflexota bacterium]